MENVFIALQSFMGEFEASALIRLFTAVICGGIIGLERERTTGRTENLFAGLCGSNSGYGNE